MNRSDDYFFERIAEGLRALEAVRKVFPSAILAGGYLRDAWYGRAQKDIDIFIEHDAEYLVPDRLAGLAVTPLWGSLYSDFRDVEFIWNLQGYALPAQVIMLRPGYTVMSRCLEHDFSFCHIWHDGWATGFSGHFAESNAGEVTLVHCEDQKEFDRSMKRWERLRVKYPDFRLVIPERYRKFEAERQAALAGGAGTCLVCKQPFMWGVNVFTAAGRKEVGISRFCETCFDHVTAEPNEPS